MSIPLHRLYLQICSWFIKIGCSKYREEKEVEVEISKQEGIKEDSPAWCRNI